MSKKIKVSGIVNGELTVGEYILPQTDGTIGQVLKTNGLGSLAWQDETLTIDHIPVIVGTGGDYPDINSAVLAGEKDILVKNGTYSISNLEIDYDECRIVGESKSGVIFEVAAGQDGVKLYASDCYIANLTIDSETNGGAACFVIGDGKTPGSEDLTIGINNTVKNCHFQGSATTFALFVAGATYNVGNDTLTAYENGDLHYGNVITECTGTSAWDGDSFSFSLQKYGRISNNNFQGRIAFYMCKNSECSDNIVYDSVNHGIFVGAPSNNNTITNNVIYNSGYSGIKVENQLEHTPLLAGQGAIGNTISNNTIELAGGSGFEINGTENNPFEKNIISDNTIINSGNHGIYLQDAQQNNIDGNLIDTPRYDTVTYNRGSGIYLVLRTKDNNISNNTIIDERAYLCHTAIANREADTTCTGNLISGNEIRCKNQERTIWIQSDDNKIIGNVISGGYYAGVRLDGASNCMVTDNKIYNNTNQANNVYNEIWLQNTSDNNFIANNVFESSNPNIAAAGVGIDAGCTGNNIGINYYNGPTADITDSGTDTEIHVNKYADDFVIADWSGSGPFTLTYAASTHGLIVKDDIMVQVQEAGTPSTVVVPQIQVASNGDITLTTTTAFDGKIIIVG